MYGNCDNLILIGMSGAGKSTLGVLLAKALGKNFFDTDLLIQQSEGRLLQQIIDGQGIDAFLQIEERLVSELAIHGCVIATGGSVVYSEQAMRHLGETGKTVYLKVAYEDLAGRLSNITTRGIVFKGASDLRSVYEERLPLYERYADLTVDCTGKDIESCVGEIVERLEKER
ncbi:MAG: shikimate kinase [Clostridia bacterium]|nr:shikimate kinase [Clostridia bacterium]